MTSEIQVESRRAVDAEMNSTRLLALLRLFACLLALTGGISTRGEDTIRIRADQWMPFNGDPGVEKPGFVVEILRTIFQAKGINLDYQTMPWADALVAARAGEIDAVIGANKVESEGLIMPGESIGYSSIGIFSKKSAKWKYENIKSLNDVKVGVVEGYVYWDSLDQYLAKNSGGNVVWFQGEAPLQQAIKALNKDEVNAVIETVPVFIWNMKANGLKMADFNLIYRHPGEQIYVSFAKNKLGRKHANLFDDGLARLRFTGKLQEILARYGLTDWKTE